MFKTTKKTCIVIFLLMAAQISSMKAYTGTEDYHLFGVIKDQKTERKIHGARVTIDAVWFKDHARNDWIEVDITDKMISNSLKNGCFEIDSLFAGKFSIIIDHEDYQSLRIPLYQISDELNFFGEIELTPLELTVEKKTVKMN